MQTADFIFHGLFPIPAPQQGNAPRHLARILFDATHGDQSVSHATAELFLHEKSDELEVRYELPFSCPDFAAAAVQYYQFIQGPQSTSVSHSGPKGKSVIGHDVIRAEWHTVLPVGSQSDRSAEGTDT